MKRKIGLILILGACGFAGCGNPTTEATVNDTTAKIAMDTMSTKTYEVSLVDNKKDPTCGMPVTAGISDTTHYDKHVIGFCSTACKDEFLRNPKGGLAAAELKK